MKIILLEDHDKLGEAGTVVIVANGYARNFLIPKNIAAPAVPEILNRIKAIQAAAERKRMAELSSVKDIFSALEKKYITIPAKVGNDQKLFGSVNSADIVKFAKAQLGLKVERRWMDFAPIKYAGEHIVEMQYHHQLTQTLKVIIYPENFPAPVIVDESEVSISETSNTEEA